MDHTLLMASFVGLAAGAVWLSQRHFGHPLSPFSVFYGVWFVALALLFADWIEYIPLHRRTWVLLTVNMLSFGFGWLLAYLFLRGGTKPSKRDVAELGVSANSLRRVIYSFFVLGTVGLADFLRQVHAAVGLWTYVESPHEIREAMGLGQLGEGLKPLNWLNVGNVPLCAFYLVLPGARHRKRIWLLLAASTIATLFMEDRTRFFFAVLWTSYVVAHARPWNARKFLAGAAVVGTILLLQFLAVGAWLGKVTENNPTLVSASRASDGLSMFLMPYIYATGSFPAFQAYVESSPESTGGAMTFYPAYRVLQRLDASLPAPPIIGDPVAIPFEFNTFTWLHQFYADFGFAGVLLGPWLAGLLAGLVYFRMVQSPSFYTLYVNGLISVALTLSIMVNHLTQGPVWYFLAVGILVAAYIRQRRPSLASAGATA
jgi:oligosaccharide repeat unit polymerase